MPKSPMSPCAPTIGRCGPSPTISFANSTLPRHLDRLPGVNTLTVELGDRSYPILIGERLLRQPELLRQHVTARDILLVSNTTVAPLYLDLVAAAFSDARVVEAI